MKVLLIDTSHYPLRESDYAALREQVETADVVIHTFTPHKAEVVKGDAQIIDMRQEFDGSFKEMSREGNEKPWQA